MATKVLFFIFAITSFLSYYPVCAQNDTSWLDLGGLKLKREFTQSVSIKAEDLEKMPFVNLSEAINTWLYGVYSNELSLMYVVDGNFLSDVNLYSIYDIEEIVFVKNALIQVNGAIGQSQLVLITTKKNRSAKWGITIAGQSALVHTDFSRIYPGNNFSSHTNAYHQYEVQAHRSFENIMMGLSANYTRDVLPSLKVDSILTSIPFNLTRFRLNGFSDWKLGARNEIYASLNFTPQKMDLSQTYNNHYTLYDGRSHQIQRVFAPFVRWHSEIVHALNNDLSITYLSSVGKLDSVLKDTNTQISSTGQIPYILTNSGTELTNHLLIRERIAYTIKTNSWNIETSLNASYEHWKYTSTVSETILDGLSGFGGFGGFSSLFQTEKGIGDLYLLTPSLILYFKNIFQLQGGWLYNFTPSHGQKFKKTFPFLNVAIDLLKTINKESRSSLKLFGSYAQSSPITIKDYPLNDLSTKWSGSDFMLTQYAIFGPPIPQNYNSIFGSNTYFPLSLLSVNYWIWETGASLSVLGDRLQLNYNYEQRRYQGESIGYFSAYSNNPPYSLMAFHALVSSTNFLGISVEPIAGEFIQWKTSLNLGYIYTRFNPIPSTYYYVQYGVGDFQNNQYPSWTGGWVNQFRYKEFTMGLNCLYHFNESTHLPSESSAKTNSLLLQNIYVCFHIHGSKAKNIEIFLDSRNLFQNKRSDLTDGRKYYGLGGKIGV